jgi:hypothetical protein
MKSETTHNELEFLIPPTRIEGAEAERILWPTGPIPVGRALTGRKLLVDIENLQVVLTAQQARRLAYALLLEAENLT